MPVVLIGRRLPVVEGKPTMPERPGDYCGPVYGYTGDAPAVFFLKPNARDPGATPFQRSVKHVVSPPHTFRECPDGSLEIRASLGDTYTYPDGSTQSDGWHGWLDEGHAWRL